MSNHDTRREMQREARRLAKANGTSYQSELAQLQSQTDDLEPFIWDFDRHLMVTGPAGAGKTVLLKMLAAEANCKVVVLTQWPREWDGLGYDVASGLQDAVDVATQTVEGRKPVVVVVDTLAYFTTVLLPDEVDRELTVALTGLMERMAREGHTYGIRLLIATQRVLPSDREVALNCAQVIVGNSPIHHRMSVGADRWPGIDTPARPGIVYTSDGPKNVRQH